MSYMEEIFERAELKFNGDKEEMWKWLNGFRFKPGNEYESDGVKVSDEFNQALRLAYEVESTIKAEDLKSIESSLQSITFGKEDVQTKLTDQKEFLEEESVTLIKTTTKEADLERAYNNLRILNYRRLNALSGGRKRTAVKYFRELFEGAEG